MERLKLYLFRPFRVIKYNKTSFFIWALSTFLGGNIGVLINFIVRHYFYKISISDSITYDLESGTLYVFVIAMLASSFGTLLIDFWTKENNDFKQPKMIWLIITFFLCCFIGIFYSAYTSSIMQSNEANKSFDIWQILFFVAGTILGIYSYCLLLMDPQNEEFSMLSDKYELKESKNIKKMSEESENIKTDSNGVQL